MPSPARLPRNFIIALSVVLLHFAALWALQAGLLRRVVEDIVPAEILSEWMEPSTPKPQTMQPTPTVSAKPQKENKENLGRPALQEPHQTVSVKETAPIAEASSPNAPIAPPAQVSPSAPPSTATAVLRNPTPTPSAAASPAPPRLELPSSDAQYLQNPKPFYPPISKRLGEEGKVVVRVLIGVDGKAEKVEIQQSSNFERLDQAALITVSKWRFVPGKRAGVPEAMWFNVPISFVLE